MFHIPRAVHKFCSFSLSLSLSSTHTHTRTHSQLIVLFHIWSVMVLNRSQKRCLLRHRMDTVVTWLVFERKVVEQEKNMISFFTLEVKALRRSSRWLKRMNQCYFNSGHGFDSRCHANLLCSSSFLTTLSLDVRAFLYLFLIFLVIRKDISFKLFLFLLI